LGQNLVIEDQPENVTIKAIPIGLENLALGRAGRKKYLKIDSAKATDRILVPPMAPSNPIRAKVLNDLSEDTGVYEIHLEYLYAGEYFKLVNDYKFVLCLEGNGYDSHRIWETLYRNSFPVMLKTSWSEGLKELGVPIYLIDSIRSPSPDSLREFLQTHEEFDCKKIRTLWIPYWESLIASKVIK
jgi:hypothetical protein